MYQNKCNDFLLNLRILIILVESKSFTRTSEKTGLSISTVTRKIKTLESYFKENILQPTKNKTLSITSFGKALYHRFKHVEDIFLDLRSEQMNQKQIKCLSILLPTTFSKYLITPFLLEFTKQHPTVTMSVDYLNYYDRVVTQDAEKLFENYDIVVGKDFKTNKNYEVRYLRKTTVKLHCTKEYFTNHGIPTNKSELTKHNVIGYATPKDNIIHYPVFVNDVTHESFVLHMASNLYLSSIDAIVDIGLQSNHIFGAWDFMICDEIATGDVMCILPNYSCFPQEWFIRTKVRSGVIEQDFIKFLYDCMNRTVVL